MNILKIFTYTGCSQDYWDHIMHYPSNEDSVAVRGYGVDDSNPQNAERQFKDVAKYYGNERKNPFNQYRISLTRETAPDAETAMAINEEFLKPLKDNHLILAGLHEKHRENSEYHIHNYVSTTNLRNGKMLHAKNENNFPMAQRLARLKVDSIEQVQRVMGELDYFVVKLAERNPDAVKQRLKAAITSAKEIVSTLPRRSQSSSAVMLISTAIMLAKGGVLTDADVQGVQDWLRTEAKSRTSMGRSAVKAAGTALSKAICSGVLKIANQFGPPFWSYDKAFIASDDSLNITRETLDEEILPELPVGKNKALEYLQKEDALNTDGGDQKTWTVETEDGKRKPRRFYSFSRDLLTSEADRIVDEAIASDLFHKQDEPIDNFFPFIKHRRLDMVAGQLITD